MDSIRLAIIGCGRIYLQNYRPALQKLGWRPAVYVDRDLEGAKCAASGAAADAATDLDSVIDGFDAAIVTGQHLERGKLSRKLIDAGKHLLVRPPISLSAEEAERAYSAAQSIIFDSSHFRHSKAARWIKSLLEEEQLGDVLEILAVVGKGYPASGRTSSTSSGGGVFAEHGMVIADLMTWWLGDVSANSHSDDSLGGTEAESITTLSSSQGAQGRIELSRTRPLPSAITVRGRGGWVAMDLKRFNLSAEPQSLLAQRFSGLSGRDSRDRSERNVYMAQLKDWRAAIASGRQSAYTSGAIQTVSVLAKCRQLRSPLNHSWVQPRITGANEGARVSSKLNGRRVLVTGATGFIGTRLVEKLLLENGARVTALARHPGRAARLARLDVELRQTDLANPSELEGVVADHDFIFNLAYDFKRSAAENVSAFRNLAEASANSGVERFIQVSSIAVYDDWPGGNLSETSPKEKTGSDYKNAKMQIDRELSGFTAFSSAIIQPTIVYGPHGWLWTDLKVEQLMTGTVILPDQGQGLCPAVYVDDVAGAMILAAVADTESGADFIVSGGEPVTWRNFYEAYEQALGVQALQFVDSVALSTDESGGGKLKSYAANPLEIANSPSVRYVLNKIEQTLGDQAIEDLRAQVAALRGSAGPQTYYPSSSDMALLQSKGLCSIDKAAKHIGYRPSFSFAEGAKLTADYIRWRYVSDDKPKSI